MLKIYPLKFFCQMFFWVSANLLNFFSHTYMLRYIVNGLQEGKKIHIIFTYVFFMLAINIVIDSVRAVYDNIALPVIDRRCEQRLNQMIYRRSIKIDLANYENPESFETYDRATSTGAEAIQDVIGTVGSAVVTILSVSLESWMLFKIDPFLFVFVAIPFLFAPLQMRTEKKYYDYRKETQRINRRKDYVLRCFFQSEFAKEMRLTNFHSLLQKRFSELINEHLIFIKRQGLRIALTKHIESLSTTILSNRVAQIYAVYQTLVSNTMMYGDCLVVMNTIGSLSNTVSEITYIFSDIYNVAMNIQDYRDFMESEIKVAQPSQKAELSAGDIECENLCFRYDGTDEDVLKNVNLRIRMGERIAIVGHNGAGKTTLVKLLMRLYDPTNGKICVNGKNIREYDLKEYRQSYGVVFQDYEQFAFTVAENVLGRPYEYADEGIVWSALKKANISDFIENQTKGIHTVLTKEFDEDGLVLSGGQAQKLAIATVYARNIHTAILDEPSAALDPLAENQLYKSMVDISADKTVIFISHRLSFCVYVDRIIYMENGTVIENGTHDELMLLNGKYADMFRMQAQNYLGYEVAEGETYE